MKKLLSLILVAVLCLSAVAVLAEEVAEPEAAEVETFVVANSFGDLQLTPPSGISMSTKRIGDVTTAYLGGEVDKIEVNWAGEHEELTVEDGKVQFGHAGHKYQEGVYWAYYSMWPSGDDAYYVTIGNNTFVHSKTGRIHTIYEVRENENFFRPGVASKATITWKRTVDKGWYPKTITEEYEEGEITKVTALYRNNKGKNLVHYVVTFDDGEDGVYTVTYGANDRYYNVSAKKDGETYINGSAKYKNRWVKKSTWKWADDAGLRSIKDFAVSPRVAE